MTELNLKPKSYYRKLARKIRASLDIETLSGQIVSNLVTTQHYTGAKNILAYYPFTDEIDIKKCFCDTGKNWFLPRINGDLKTFRVCAYSLEDELEENRWKIPEPTKNAAVSDPKELDMVILPALMIDEKGIRLGYGGGFYDRFLPLLKKDCLKIALLPDELLVKTLPREIHDRPVDYVITQTKIL